MSQAQRVHACEMNPNEISNENTEMLDVTLILTDLNRKLILIPSFYTRRIMNRDEGENAHESVMR